jgi:hypothetical protein
MPLYDATGLGPLPVIAIPSQPAYFFGSFPRDTQDTQMRISTVAITSDVATVTGTIYQGNIPAVGNQISIRGTQTNSGVFNVTAATITGVTGTPSTGVYAITFALTNANVTAVADSGMAIMPIAEVPETCANGTSIAVYVPSNELRDLGEKSITVATTFPSLPTAVTVTLYAAINNNPQAAVPEWTSMGVVAVVAGGVQTAGPLQTFSTPAGRFFRVVVSGVSGGSSPTIVAKMIC